MDFAPVIDFAALGIPEVKPGAIPVLDFSHGPVPEESALRLAIGRYDEHRPGSYVTPLFAGRDIHMGIDLFAPMGTPVRAFTAGIVHLAGYNSQEGDYGGTIVTVHRLEGLELYALYGHLSRRSLENQLPGRRFGAGEVLGWIGERGENGGWVPHLHFQLSYERPARADLPGVVSREQRALARLKYPDPRLVLGALY